LEWPGRSLVRLDEAPSAEIAERLQALWEWRMDQASIESEEMEAFGWWFASGRLDDDWSLRNLSKILAASVLPEPDHMVAERLAVIAPAHPLQAVQSLDQMVELASEGWSIHGWLDRARGVLEAGLNSKDPEAKQRAERVVNRLGALRFRDFRSLLQGLEASPGEAELQPP
jgi:hypothetical protein